MNRSLLLQQQSRSSKSDVSSPNPPFTVAQLVYTLDVPRQNVEQNWPLIWSALQELGLDDRATVIAVLATVRIECPPFKPIEEYRNADGSIPSIWYTYSGGPTYHGRGEIQLTHDFNYRDYGHMLGVDLVNNPDLALDPTISARVLATYFKEHGIAAMAQAGDWQAVRRAVQGGQAGYSDFLGYVQGLEAL